jgi:DNA ligase (NAD+)
MNIDGLGEKVTRALVDAGLVKNVADLFVLTADQLVELERFAETSANNLVGAIQRARESAPFSRLLAALGIRHVGGVAARVIAQRYRSLGELVALADRSDASSFSEALSEIEGVGEVIAASLEKFLRNPKNREVLELLLRRGVNPVEPEQTPTANGPLAGKVFVITGSLSTPRSEIARRIEAAGGKVTGSVSRSTNYLVAGDKTGKNKLDAATKHGVSIIDEQTLERLLEASQTGP